MSIKTIAAAVAATAVLFSTPITAETLKVGSETVLLITTGYAIRNDKGAILNLIRDLNEAGAAALAIKTRFFDHFPEEALKLADQLQFPLFFLNNALGFIEAVYPVMVAIVEAKNGVEMRTRYQIGQIEKKELDRKFYFDLVQERFDREEEAQIRANSLYWPMMPVRMLEICTKYPEEQWSGQKKEKAEQLAETFFMKQNLGYASLFSMNSPFNRGPVL